MYGRRIGHARLRLRPPRLKGASASFQTSATTPHELAVPVSPADASPPAEGHPLPGWRRSLDVWLPLVQLLRSSGIIMYAVGRYSIGRFLAAYGIEPEEVGLTQTTLLWPVAVSVLFYTTILVGVSAVFDLLSSARRGCLYALIFPLFGLLMWNLFHNGENLKAGSIPPRSVWFTERCMACSAAQEDTKL